MIMHSRVFEWTFFYDLFLVQIHLPPFLFFARLSSDLQAFLPICTSFVLFEASPFDSVAICLPLFLFACLPSSVFAFVPFCLRVFFLFAFLLSHKICITDVLPSPLYQYYTPKISPKLWSEEISPPSWWCPWTSYQASVVQTSFLLTPDLTFPLPTLTCTRLFDGPHTPTGLKGSRQHRGHISWLCICAAFQRKGVLFGVGVAGGGSWCAGPWGSTQLAMAALRRAATVVWSWVWLLTGSLV